ncbi:hypothetical protein HDU96_008457, partial [Phlyctochytrium bullatum]
MTDLPQEASGSAGPQEDPPESDSAWPLPAAVIELLQSSLPASPAASIREGGGSPGPEKRKRSASNGSATSRRGGSLVEDMSTENESRAKPLLSVGSFSSSLAAVPLNDARSITGSVNSSSRISAGNPFLPVSRALVQSPVEGSSMVERDLDSKQRSLHGTTDDQTTNDDQDFDLGLPSAGIMDGRPLSIASETASSLLSGHEFANPVGLPAGLAAPTLPQPLHSASPPSTPTLTGGGTATQLPSYFYLSTIAMSSVHPRGSSPSILPSATHRARSIASSTFSSSFSAVPTPDMARSHPGIAPPAAPQHLQVPASPTADVASSFAMSYPSPSPSPLPNAATPPPLPHASYAGSLGSGTSISHHPGTIGNIHPAASGAWSAGGVAPHHYGTGGSGYSMWMGFGSGGRAASSVSSYFSTAGRGGGGGGGATGTLTGTRHGSSTPTKPARDAPPTDPAPRGSFFFRPQTFHPTSAPTGPAPHPSSSYLDADAKSLAASSSIGAASRRRSVGAFSSSTNPFAVKLFGLFFGYNASASPAVGGSTNASGYAASSAVGVSPAPPVGRQGGASIASNTRRRSMSVSSSVASRASIGGGNAGQGGGYAASGGVAQAGSMEGAAEDGGRRGGCWPFRRRRRRRRRGDGTARWRAWPVVRWWTRMRGVERAGSDVDVGVKAGEAGKVFGAARAVEVEGGVPGRGAEGGYEMRERVAAEAGGGEGGAGRAGVGVSVGTNTPASVSPRSSVPGGRRGSAALPYKVGTGLAAQAAAGVSKDGYLMPADEPPVRGNLSLSDISQLMEGSGSGRRGSGSTGGVGGGPDGRTELLPSTSTLGSFDEREGEGRGMLLLRDEDEEGGRRGWSARSVTNDEEGEDEEDEENEDYGDSLAPEDDEDDDEDGPNEDDDDDDDEFSGEETTTSASITSFDTTSGLTGRSARSGYSSSVNASGVVGAGSVQALSTSPDRLGAAPAAVGSSPSGYATGFRGSLSSKTRRRRGRGAASSMASSVARRRRRRMRAMEKKEAEEARREVGGGHGGKRRRKKRIEEPEEPDKPLAGGSSGSIRGAKRWMGRGGVILVGSGSVAGDGAESNGDESVGLMIADGDRTRSSSSEYLGSGDGTKDEGPHRESAAGRGASGGKRHAGPADPAGSVGAAAASMPNVTSTHHAPSAFAGTSGGAHAGQSVSFAIPSSSDGALPESAGSQPLSASSPPSWSTRFSPSHAAAAGTGGGGGTSGGGTGARSHSRMSRRASVKSISTIATTRSGVAGAYYHPHHFPAGAAPSASTSYVGGSAQPQAPGSAQPGGGRLGAAPTAFPAAGSPVGGSYGALASTPPAHAVGTPSSTYPPPTPPASSPVAVGPHAPLAVTRPASVHSLTLGGGSAARYSPGILAAPSATPVATPAGASVSFSEPLTSLGGGGAAADRADTVSLASTYYPVVPPRVPRDAPSLSSIRGIPPSSILNGERGERERDVGRGNMVLMVGGEPVVVAIGGGGHRRRGGGGGEEGRDVTDTPSVRTALSFGERSVETWSV